MNLPVLADWLTLILGPMGLVFLLLAFRAKRKAAKSDPPTTGVGNGWQWAGAICLFLMIAMRLTLGA